jgi:hypothetical protein
MGVVHPRCAGMDISTRDATACVRHAGAGRRKTVEVVTTWRSMTGQILALREHLAAEQVTCVVMAATGDYWKPFDYLLEGLPGVEVMLVNARHVKTFPGRKTTSRTPPGWPNSALTAGPWVVRSARTDPPTAGPDPRQDRDHSRTRSRGAAAGEAVGRTPASSCPRSPATSPACPGERCSRRSSLATGNRLVWPIWPRSASVQDPRAHRGAARTVQRAPRVPGAHTLYEDPGPQRRGPSGAGGDRLRTLYPVDGRVPAVRWSSPPARYGGPARRQTAWIIAAVDDVAPATRRTWPARCPRRGRPRRGRSCLWSTSRACAPSSRI